MAIRIASFAGEIPRLIPRLLNDNYAQIAQNTKLEQGNLLPIRRGRFVTKLSAAAKTIFRHGNDWLSWSSVVDAVPGPVASDRLYVTGDGAPKVRFNGSFYPLALERPSAAAHAATSSTVDDANSFTVLYSYTWVTALNEESEPADQMDLFALPGEQRRDAVPVHYADLAANPKPTERKDKKR